MELKKKDNNLPRGIYRVIVRTTTGAKLRVYENGTRNFFDRKAAYAHYYKMKSRGFDVSLWFSIIDSWKMVAGDVV